MAKVQNAPLSGEAQSQLKDLQDVVCEMAKRIGVAPELLDKLKCPAEACCDDEKYNPAKKVRNGQSLKVDVSGNQEKIEPVGGVESDEKIPDGFTPEQWAFFNEMMCQKKSEVLDGCSWDTDVFPKICKMSTAELKAFHDKMAAGKKDCNDDEREVYMNKLYKMHVEAEKKSNEKVATEKSWSKRMEMLRKNKDDTRRKMYKYLKNCPSSMASSCSDASYGSLDMGSVSRSLATLTPGSFTVPGLTQPSRYSR